MHAFCTLPLATSSRSIRPVRRALVTQTPRAAAHKVRFMPCAANTAFLGQGMAPLDPKLRRKAFRTTATFVSSSATLPSGKQPGFLGSIREKLNQKLAADKNFVFKLCCEVGIDELITVVVNILARGSPTGWDATVWAQVITQMFVACFNDIALVWALAPEDAEAGGKAKIAHMFQPGAYSMAERAGCWLQKWRLYSALGTVCGFLSSLATALITRDAALLTPLILGRAALTGCLHLGVSANTRYQLVNGLEVLVYKALPSSAARTGSVVLRAANNFAGARLWMLLSAFIAARVLCA